MDELPIPSGNKARERIVNDHIWKTVWWLSWPSVITMLLQSLNGLVDAAFVGRLGAAALSGVGLASQVMFTLMACSATVSVGATALVARFVGAGEPKNAEEVARQSISLALVMSIITGGLLYFLGPILIAAMGGKGEALRLSVTYLNILLLGIVPFFFMFILTGIFRGAGDMRTPLVVMTIVTVVSLVGDYVLIFGIGPFPKLGIVGAGIATVTSRVTATVMLLAYIPKSLLRDTFRGSWRPAWGWYRRILSIGAPSGIQGLLRSGASMIFCAILGMTPEGIFAIAALTIGIRMESLAFMPGLAFSIAATAMVGQNLGARKPERATHSAWAAAWQGTAVMGVMGLLFIILAYPIASIFTSDPKVLPLAAQYLQINGISEPFLALAIILTGALEGAGQTRLPTAATILTLWIVRVPLTYYLTITLGLHSTGAWISMAATAIISGLIILAIFKWTRWQETRV